MVQQKVQRNSSRGHEERIPSKEEVLDMIAEGLRQAKSGKGLRPARELLNELRVELRAEAENGAEKAAVADTG